MKSTICNQVQGLVPGYMDGELSEEQAAPLRKHLLSCPTCRSSAQELAGLSHWFLAPDTVEIPPGFAARVARAAFSGGTEASPPRHMQVSPSKASHDAADTGLHSFVLGSVSVAAALLLSLSLFMAQAKQPKGHELSAEPIPVTLEELDRLNAAEDASAMPATSLPKLPVR